jgi:hypothetical protein
MEKERSVEVSLLSFRTLVALLIGTEISHFARLLNIHLLEKHFKKEYHVYMSH